MTWLRRHLMLVLGGAVAAGLAAVALWPTAITVDVADVTRGALTVTLDEDGETRVHHRYVVSAPVAGRLERIDLDPGDAVTKDTTIVARLRPEAPQLLDARTRAEATAAIAAARAAGGRARAERERAAAARALAASDLSRERALAAGGLTSAQALEAREHALVSADEALAAARFGEATATAELTRAQARLRADVVDGGGPVEVRSPVDGVVLRRFLDSESVVAAGARLLEIGDPSHVEIVSDLLSSDAVKVKPGMRVAIDGSGGGAPLGARVQRIEPAGFTKVSALGVDEQRVNVIMDVDDSRAAWTALGDGYRVEVRIALWSATDVVTAPASAFVREGDGWAAFVVDGGRVRRQTVTIGHRTPRVVEITDGLAPGARVVVHPPDTLADGSRVVPR